jgi:hypothetical protein
MKIKKLLPVLLIFLTIGCGFTPVYLSKNDYNFSIEQIAFTGDKELNNFLKTKLRKFKKENISKKFTINVVTIYEKNILTKDMTGKTTNYELVAKVEFTINPGNKKFNFINKKIMESEADKFEEKKYEKVIKQNFSTYFSEQLITELINFQ